VVTGTKGELRIVSRRILFTSISFALLLSATFNANSAHAAESKPECWAVIIGVSDYKHLHDLQYCDDDAEDLAEYLRPIWGGDHIKLLTDDEATKENIEEAITSWLASREDAGDTVLIFFSGHGGANHESYIAPHDSLLYSYANDISGDEFNGWLDTLDSEKVVVILDTCTAASFGSEISENGRVILMATSYGGISGIGLEDPVLEHGIFSYFILEALREFGPADSDNDYELSAEEIFDYAKLRTPGYGQLPQRPIILDCYAGELDLVIKVEFDVEPQMPPDTTVLVVDKNIYSSTEMPVSFTWAPGAVHDIDVPSSVIEEDNRIRYVFTAWSDGEASPSRTISYGGTYTANYKTQYYLTVDSEYGDPQGEGWYDSGSTATFSVSPVDDHGNGPSATLVMDSPKTVTSNWKLQYYLTVDSEYGDPQGEGWYDSGSTATFSHGRSQNCHGELADFVRVALRTHRRGRGYSYCGFSSVVETENHHLTLGEYFPSL